MSNLTRKEINDFFKNEFIKPMTKRGFKYPKKGARHRRQVYKLKNDELIYKVFVDQSSVVGMVQLYYTINLLFDPFESPLSIAYNVGDRLGRDELSKTPWRAKKQEDLTILLKSLTNSMELVVNPVFDRIDSVEKYMKESTKDDRYSSYVPFEHVYAYAYLNKKVRLFEVYEMILKNVERNKERAEKGLTYREPFDEEISEMTRFVEAFKANRHHELLKDYAAKNISILLGK